MPSRLFKRSRFAARGYETDFDAHFLRWMLSDGAGACLLSTRPRSAGCRSSCSGFTTRSFSGDYPVCMQIGLTADGTRSPISTTRRSAEAEAAGAFLLRQDIRLLPHLFDLGIHEYAGLVRTGCSIPAASITSCATTRRRIRAASSRI